MNIKNKIKGLMAVATLSACTAAPLEEQVIENCALTFPPDQVLAPYVKVLNENQSLLQSTQLCTATPSLQQLFWDKLRLAEEAGSPPDNFLPAGFDSLQPKEYFWEITPYDAEQIQSAYLAHALWIDQQGMLPWKLADYHPEELRALFDPKNHFWEWSPAEQKYEIGYLLDHSPAAALFIAKKMIGDFPLTDQISTVAELIKNLRHYRHGNSGAKNSEGEVYCFDSEIIPTMEEMAETKVSTFGCQTMAPYLCTLAIAYNIPCETVEGYYGGVGHRTALLKITNQVLPHGDNVYDHLLLNTPSKELLDNYQFWEKEILPYPYAGVDSEVAYKSKLHNMENAVKHPSRLIINGYCRDGREKLDEYFDLEKINLLEQEILKITQNCAVIPEDNPDGTGESYRHICTAEDDERESLD